MERGMSMARSGLCAEPSNRSSERSRVNGVKNGVPLPRKICGTAVEISRTPRGVRVSTIGPVNSLADIRPVASRLGLADWTNHSLQAWRW
jgi:hypothetical protein